MEKVKKPSNNFIAYTFRLRHKYYIIFTNMMLGTICLLPELYLIQRLFGSKHYSCLQVIGCHAESTNVTYF
jgi:hypothetical protein